MGKKVAPTLRERQVFAALFEELISHLPKGSKNFPTTHTHLTQALDLVKSNTGRMEHREKLEQAQFERDFGHEDYRG